MSSSSFLQLERTDTQGDPRQRLHEELRHGTDPGDRGLHAPRGERQGFHHY